MPTPRAFSLFVLVVAVTLALALALTTTLGVNPDEALHLDAFRCFEGRFWPPDLDSDDLLYDAFGTSKAYSLELTYTLLANPGGLLRRLLGAPAFLVYRLINVLLLPAAFLPLLLARPGVLPLRAIALVGLALPQVIYLFSYANSDAFAVAASLWLIAYAARLFAKPAPWGVADAAILGLLAGLLGAAKPNFAFALIAPAALLIAPARQRLTLRGLGTLAFVGLLLVAPLRVVYPLTQSTQFRQDESRVRQRRAAEGYKRSGPEAEGLWLADRGVAPSQVLLDQRFLVRSAQSLWGVYGHMTVFHPAIVYVAAGALGLLNLGLTVAAAVRLRGGLPSPRRILLLLAPGIVLLNLGSSFSRSYFFAFQPQGRYLFPSLVCFGLVLAGTSDFEGPRESRLRAASLALALLLAWASLCFVALPALSR